MYRLKEKLKHYNEKYKNQLERLNSGEQIDSEKYSKHHYWQLGYINGILHGLEIINDLTQNIEDEE